MAQAACVDFASTVRCEMDSLEFQRVMPAFVADIVRCLKERLGLEQPLDTALAEPDDAMPWTAENAPADTSLDDEIPF
jgi:hypothetical protein